MKSIQIQKKRWLKSWAIFFLLSYGWANGQSAATWKDSISRYLSKGKIEKTLPFARKRVEAEKNEKGEKSLAYANALRSCGDLLSRAGYFSEGETFLKKAVPLYQELCPGDSFQLGLVYQTYGLHLFNAGEYDGARKYYIQAMEQKKKNPHPDSAELAVLLDNLGTTAYQTGHYGQAEDLLQEGLALRIGRYGTIHTSVATSYNNLGNFYKYLGNFTRAETHYRKAIAIYSQETPVSLAPLALYQNNLGSNLRAERRFQESLIQNMEAYRIKNKWLDPENPDLAVSLNSLGCVYLDLNGFARARSYFNQALGILEKRLPADHPDVAEIQLNIAIVFSRTGRLKESDSLLRLALKTRLKRFGKNAPLLNPVIQEMALLAWKQKNWTSCDTLISQLSEMYSLQLHQYFPFFSTLEKEKFRNNVAELQELIQSYFAKRSQQNKVMSGRFFQHQINTRGLLLQSQNAMIQRIRTSKDSTVRKQLETWLKEKERLSQLKSGIITSAEGEIQELEGRIENLEKKMAKKMGTSNQIPVYNTSIYNLIRKKLKTREGIVEMVRIRKTGIIEMSDTSQNSFNKYKTLSLTDSIQYVALIITPQRPFPEVVILENGKDLEGARLALYRKSISAQLKDTSSYHSFWKSIDKKIPSSCKTIYWLPDGVYHFVNPATLLMPDKKKYLADLLDIRLITNSSEIMNARADSTSLREVYLIGFPDYEGLPSELIPDKKRSANESLLFNRFGFLQNHIFNPLPATLTEVNEIAKITLSRKLTTKLLTKDSAQEGKIKTITKPSVLHFATHGFFESDSSNLNQALFRSGIVLNGANQLFKNQEVGAKEDGILTAYEAMNLNLDNTDLVVLSACETGLGEIKNGEGVYGLQRAFKVAGAKSIIMSLWKVDDDATQELMVNFYKNWLQNVGDGSQSRRSLARRSSAENDGNGSQSRRSLAEKVGDDSQSRRSLARRSSAEKVGNGLSSANNAKRSAFLKAQKQLRAKYPNPYYWGAFVMVGE